MKALLYFLGITALIANATDLLSTLVGLGIGAAKELNPMYLRLGAENFFLLKIAVMIPIALGLLLTTKYPKHANMNLFWAILFVCLITVFTFATINNIGVILSCHI